MWRVVEWLMRRDIDPLFNEFITSIGGQPRELFGLQGMYSPELNLIAASPSINKPPPDLSKKHKFTGVWFVDEPDYEAPQALTDFLAQGPAPIVITFGSMGGTKGAETTQILLEAVKRTERRAIIHAGWENLGLDESPEDIFFVGYVPYRFLFRQVCCVVHHGGAGTTASVCRAGVPSVVVPHLGDQSYWGNALGKLGVAPKILYRQDMTAKRLANRIDEAIGSKTMAENARRLGQQINTEDGLATAVELIEKHAKEKGIG
jgi:UDP:flavonoid glycosyltransferase YjiC (YdhE family)